MCSDGAAVSDMDTLDDFISLLFGRTACGDFWTDIRRSPYWWASAVLGASAVMLSVVLAVLDQLGFAHRAR